MSAEQRRVRAHVGRAVRRVVEPVSASRATSDSVASVIASVVARRWRASFIVRTTSGCGAAGREADDERALVDPRQAAERLLRRARRRPRRGGRAASAGGAGSWRRRPSGRCRRSASFGAVVIASTAASTSSRDRSARGLLDVHVIGRERGLELGLVEREQRRSPPLVAAVGRGARRYSSRAACWSSGKPSKPSACEKRTTVELEVLARLRQLLGRVERRLVEVIDDVLGDVLLGAGELVEARDDVGGERSVASDVVALGVLLLGSGGDSSLHRRARVSTAPLVVPSRPRSRLPFAAA